MKRTVWHHKGVFQTPPRGVFRSRFLWDSLVLVYFALFANNIAGPCASTPVYTFKLCSSNLEQTLNERKYIRGIAQNKYRYRYLVLHGLR